MPQARWWSAGSGLLADEQMVRTVKHQATLLLRGLCWDEPHVGAGDRLANCLCVSHVVLLSLDIGLYVSRRHQSHGMAKRLELARPMVRRGAGFDTDQTRRQLLKERQDIPTLQLPQ